MSGSRGFTLEARVKKGNFLLSVMESGVKYLITNNPNVPPHRRLNTVLEQHGARVKSVNALSNYIVFNHGGKIKITQDRGQNVYEKK